METNFLKNAENWISLANENIKANDLKTAAVELLLAVKWLDIADFGRIIDARQAEEISRMIDEIL